MTALSFATPFHTGLSESAERPSLFSTALSSHEPLFYQPIVTSDRLARSAWYVSCKSGGSAGREGILTGSQAVQLWRDRRTGTVCGVGAEGGR